MTARYEIEAVPPSPDTDRSRYALNRSATGQNVSTAQNQTICWQRLLEALEATLEPLAHPPATVIVPRITRLSTGEYVLRPWQEISAIPEFKSKRAGQFQATPAETGGALLDNWFTPEGFGTLRDEDVAEAFRAAAEREQTEGWQLNVLNKLMLRALTLRAGLKIDLAWY